MVFGNLLYWAVKWNKIEKEKYYCEKNSMLKWLHHGCAVFSEQLDIIDCIGKYFYKEKDCFFVDA